MTATAWFYVASEDEEGALTLHPVTADWTEANLTWDAIGGQFESGVYGSFPPQPVKDVWVSINVTALAQNWVSNPTGNYGFLLNATSIDNESQYTSREHGTASLRPYLEVTTADAAVSPVQISATGTLTGNPSPANDITRTLTRSAVPAYQPASTLNLQLSDTGGGKDNTLDNFYSSRNYGGSTYLQIYADAGWITAPLIQFDLPDLPPGARVLEARFELHTNNVGTGGTATVYRVTRDWVEGTKSGGGIADGSTWDTWDGTNTWAQPGGEYVPMAVAATDIPAGMSGWGVSWDIAALVQDWVDGTAPNHGLMLRSDGVLNNAQFVSRDENNPVDRPRLTVTYACECGSPCLAPQGSGKVLLVVDDANTPVASDIYKKTLLEAWGYSVAMLSDNASQSTFNTDIGLHDVVYISETVDPALVAGKLSNAPIGIVNEEGLLNDDLGISNNAGVTAGSSINVTDTSHYITALFPAGPLDIYDADMELLVIFNGPAPDLQTLADVGGYSSLVTLEAGAALKGGATAASRRVMLPLGRDSKFNWDYLNGNGRLMVQRALQWGTGNMGAPPVKLLFVGEDTSPNGEEQLRIDLIESWGYAVTVIDDDDTQANFDVAVAANDVAYVSSTVSKVALGTKLKAAPIGLVNEQGALVEEFGFGTQNVNYKSRIEIDVLDNTHYITTPFPTGLLTVLTGNQILLVFTASTAPGFDALAQVFNTGSLWDDSLGVIDIGGDLYGGGTAAGRRVQLPWGDATFDVAALNADGLTLMQRAIEWAEGAGAVAAPESVLLVVADRGNLTAEETARKTLIEGWGYTVNLIDDADSQANFDTAVAANDVAYVPSTTTYTNVTGKLDNAGIGIVFELHKLTPDFGLATSTNTGPIVTDIDIVENTHYITSVFPIAPLTIFNTSVETRVILGTLAPSLITLGEASGSRVLNALDVGATQAGGSPSPGRRVKLPWGASGFDPSDLSADGVTLMQRAIEWAGTPPSIPVPLLLVVNDASSLQSEESAGKALMESWGYAVTPISASASQADYDTALASVDVAYIMGSISSTDLGTKLTAATVGVVSEDAGLMDEFGIAEPLFVQRNTQFINIVDNTHYVTSGLSLGDLGIFSSPQDVWTVSGTLAPGLQLLGETKVAGTGYPPGVAVLEAGAALYGGGSAAGRRAQVPWSNRINVLTADGLDIMKRAIEWGAGVGSGGGGGGPTGIVFGGFTEASKANGTNVTIDKPFGTAAGDLLIAAVATDGDRASSLAAPAGWNSIDLATEGGDVTFGVWWKLAGASESGSYTMSWSGNEHAYGWIMRFTGVDPSNPIDASANTGGTSSAPTSPAVTTTVTDTVVLRLGGFDDDDINTGAPGLSGHTVINMGDSGNGGSTASGGSGFVLQPAAGNSGTSSFDLTNSEQYRAVTIAITPAP